MLIRCVSLCSVKWRVSSHELVWEKLWRINLGRCTAGVATTAVRETSCFILAFWTSVALFKNYTSLICHPSDLKILFLWRSDCMHFKTMPTILYVFVLKKGQYLLIIQGKKFICPAVWQYSKTSAKHSIILHHCRTCCCIFSFLPRFYHYKLKRVFICFIFKRIPD